MSEAKVTRSRHAAFPTSLSPKQIVETYWRELKQILPADEVVVVDPYMLDGGGEDPHLYAGNVTNLLLPVLDVVQRLVLMHGKPRQGIQERLERNFKAAAPGTALVFHRAVDLHSRYLVADRLRVIRMEFSFNRIGKVFGTVSVVENEEDRVGILGEVDRLLL
ncbi:hypothetical protein ACTHQ6_15435 [Arthrobacter sp. SAFR-179]|uniref:hypothetical protein n=1 Tax=Arthrobacter sp. SAFR-179 TaxID=3387279 RepID=UPI003F7C26E1